MLHVVNSTDMNFQRSNKNAIVTMAIGERYSAKFRKVALPSFLAYAERHQMDVVLIEFPLDQSQHAQQRSPSWQKCLILNQPWSSQYERIIWIDADVVINPNAPNILDEAGHPWLIAATVNEAQLSDAAWVAFWEGREVPPGPRWLKPHQDIAAARAHRNRRMYFDDGHDVSYDIMIQGGVWVMSPKYHNKLLLKTYQHHSAHRWYEQTVLSKNILESGAFQEITPRYNWLFGFTVDSYVGAGEAIPRDYLWRIIRGEYNKAYFLHFCHEQSWNVFDGF